MKNFYSVIIGSELLNGRRVDKHFNHLNTLLREKNFKHVANLVIQDHPLQIQNCFTMILNDPKSVMFCFGGLGATPDDITRAIASDIFTAQPLVFHEEAKELIEKQFGEEAYPHRITMAMLPPTSELLHNVVNNVPGFCLEGRFFFMPGFPSMAWPMVEEVLHGYFPNAERPLFSTSFIAEAPENDLIEIMEALPKELEFSSLPRFVEEKRMVEIYLAHSQEEIVKKWENYFKQSLKTKNIAIKDCW